MTRVPPDEVGKVAVIGTGLIGAAWTSLFLARGIEVLAIDPASDAEARLLRTVARMVPTLREIGLVSESADFERVRVASEPGPDLSEARFVQESITESLDLKHAVLASVEALIGPDVVIASSTSALRISDIQRGARYPERYVAGHPINPPHIMPLIEVSGGALTAIDAVEWAMRFYAWLGKKPVRLMRDIEGHIAGRLSAALWREAVSLVEQGIAGVEEIDEAVRHGPGLRWATMGPHITYHLGGGEGGIRHYLEHLGPSQQKRWDSLGTPRLTTALINRIAEGVLNEARGRSVSDLEDERDRRLAAAIKIFSEIS